jgi:hypothetical protein
MFKQLDAVTQAAASGFTLQPASSPGSYGWSCCAAYELPGVSRVYIYRRQSPSSCNDRLFQLRDLEFMLARDAFIGFTCTFDAILQFRAQWRQKLRDGKDSSPLQVCDYSPTENLLAVQLSRCVWS